MKKREMRVPPTGGGVQEQEQEEEEEEGGGGPMSSEGHGYEGYAEAISSSRGTALLVQDIGRVLPSFSCALLVGTSTITI